MSDNHHRAPVSPWRRFFQGCSIGLALVVGSVSVLLLAGVVRFFVVAHHPDPEACTTDLVQIGLRNIRSGTPGTGQARPDSCADLTEAQYAKARDDAALRITAVLARH